MTDESTFLSCIEPALRRNDLRAALAQLDENWPPDRLIKLTASAEARVAQVAARALGLVGTLEHQGALVRLLGHPDATVVEAAETALWHLWMRAGTPQANRLLARAVRSLRQQRLAEARALLEAVTLTDPLFAEAHHQLGLVAALEQDHPSAAAAWEMAAGLNPLHYPARLELGHLAALEGDLAGALKFYEQALKIHPRLEAIREIVPRLRAAAAERSVA